MTNFRTNSMTAEEVVTHADMRLRAYSYASPALIRKQRRSRLSSGCAPAPPAPTVACAQASMSRPAPACNPPAWLTAATMGDTRAVKTETATRRRIRRRGYRAMRSQSSSPMYGLAFPAPCPPALPSPCVAPPVPPSPLQQLLPQTSTPRPPHPPTANDATVSTAPVCRCVRIDVDMWRRR